MIRPSKSSRPELQPALRCRDPLRAARGADTESRVRDPQQAEGSRFAIRPPAAVVFITDPDGYEGYVPGVLPLLQKHNAEILVADYEAETLEGQGCGVNVVLKFDSEEAARNWYNDPDYGPVKQIRFNSTDNGTAVLAKEFVMPE